MKNILDNDIQILSQELGESGCYALCLLEVACQYLGKKLPVLESIQMGIEKKCIYYNSKNPNDDDNFYVQYPETLLYYWTGKHWKVTKEKADYKLQKGEFKINRWERQATGKTIGHFDCEYFHPIANSVTCKLGKIVSTRICKVTN